MSANDAFAAGTLVNDRFRIVRLLGKGGMGEVYEAEDLELLERVALKVLSQLWRSDGQRLERFRREIHLSRKVTHPNVCRVFDVFKHHPDPELAEIVFVTMELLEGSDLGEHLNLHGRMQPEEAEPLIHQMTSALSAAHAAGVIHRDFKPSNVMLVPGKDGEVRAVVTDFGLAHSRESERGDSGPDGTVVGSIHYMAPEQVKGEPVSPASDVFALGAVMFEMVTGFRSFRGRNIAKVLTERISEPAPSVRRVGADLDERWEKVIEQCLAIDPGDRYATATEVSEALREHEVEAETAQPAAPAPHPAAVALLITASLVVLLLVAVIARRGRGPESPHRFATFDPTQLTTDPGLEIDPAFSPDGRSLVFASDADGRFEIRIRALDTRHEERILTEDGQDNVQPSWSPDGRWIAFYSENRGGIWMIPAEGGEPRQITDFGSHPAFSPDSKRLAFQSQGRIELSASSAPALPPSTIWTVTIEDPQSEALTRVGEPAGGHGVPSWSPDGERIVFSTYYGRRSEIWSVRADGSSLLPLVQKTPAAFRPVYTPDGKALLYSAVAEGERYGLWSVQVSKSGGKTSGEPRLLANLGSIGIRQLAISGDGKQLAYTALATRSNLFYQAVDAETGESRGEPEALTTGSARNNRPSFSPDGSRLAFDRWRVGVNRDIWILDEGQKEASPLTQDEGNDSQSSWSADGQKVVYVSDRQSSRALWGQAPGSEDAELLADLSEHADSVRLSPDGRALALHARESGGTVDIWTLDIAKGESRQLTHDKQFAGFPAWSPDGSRLAYEILRGEDTHIMAMSADGQSPVQLTHSPGQSWPYSWSPDGKRVAFAGKRGGFWNVYWVEVESHSEVAVTRLERRNVYVRYPEWSPRGDRIVFELAETTGDIFLVKGVE